MISDIMDRLYEIVPEVYADKLELTNPSNPQDGNPIQTLKNGYGFLVGTGTADTVVPACVGASIAREITLVLSKTVSDSNLSSSSRRTQEKDLLDESLDIIKAIRSDSQLREKVIDVDYVSDDGVTYLDIEGVKILVFNITHSYRYKEWYEELT